MASATYEPTLIDRLWPTVGDNSASTRAMRFVGLALVGTLLLTISAKISVPFYPVSMTMQTFMVLVLAAAYGRVLGTATVALYLLEGALGLPVFTGTPERGIGLAYMMGPTGGYLAGFLVCAAIVGWAADKGWSSSLVKMVPAMLLGHAIILALGVAWLSVLIGWDSALAGGLLPFIWGAIAKFTLAAIVVTAGMALLRPRG